MMQTFWICFCVFFPEFYVKFSSDIQIVNVQWNTGTWRPESSWIILLNCICSPYTAIHPSYPFHIRSRALRITWRSWMQWMWPRRCTVWQRPASPMVNSLSWDRTGWDKLTGCNSTLDQVVGLAGCGRLRIACNGNCCVVFLLCLITLNQLPMQSLPLYWAGMRKYGQVMPKSSQGMSSRSHVSICWSRASSPWSRNATPKLWLAQRGHWRCCRLGMLGVLVVSQGQTYPTNGLQMALGRCDKASNWKEMERKRLRQVSNEPIMEAILSWKVSNCKVSILSTRPLGD